VKSHNAEPRIEAMRSNRWKPEKLSSITRKKTNVIEDASEETADTDLEELARDQIAKVISAKFKNHDFTRLVEAILNAQGYTTYRSPEGSDGGADILAGAGPLGFSSPRLCVEVKSEDSPIDRPTVDKLLGAVTKFGAEEGLFVSWSGFKSNVIKEMAPSFFKVRLWTQKELLEQLFIHYDKFDEDLKAELPLKRIWTVTVQEDE
jgi:restriction system protein